HRVDFRMVHEISRNSLERVGLYHYIGVHEEEHFTTRFLSADITSPAGTRLARHRQHQRAFVATDLGAAIGRAVVNNDQFVILVWTRSQRVETTRQKPLAVVDRNDYGNERCAIHKLKQCVDERRRSGTSQSDKDAEEHDRNKDRDQVPLFIVTDEHHELAEET